MRLLGLDIGTTHCKAALIDMGGSLLRQATMPSGVQRDANGFYYYEPDRLWRSVASTINEAVASTPPGDIGVVGVASMAETGLLVDIATGQPRTPLIPWFDQRALPHAERMSRALDPRERLLTTGLPCSYKYGLAKLLWLQEQDASLCQGARWLSAADYIVFRLTGVMATDNTLAARTWAFDVPAGRWDVPWLRDWDIVPTLFPDVFPSGAIAGWVRADDDTLLAAGTPVAIAGHDHLCASVALGKATEDVAFNSIGTAETLMGMFEDWALVSSSEAVASGLAFGRHVVPERFIWLGGLPASGGSIEWLREILGSESATYDDIAELLRSAPDDPTGILYFPYLLGSGAPWPSLSARAAIVGLNRSHGRAPLLKAVMEGTAFEMEAIRRSAEAITGLPVSRLLAVGGGTKNDCWLQIKADVSGTPIELRHAPEAAAVGAALVAGAGSGFFRSFDDIPNGTLAAEARIVQPDTRRHHIYHALYEQGYLPLQSSLRAYSSQVANILGSAMGQWTLTAQPDD